MSLNQRAAEICRQLAADADRLRVSVSSTPAGTRVIDCGVHVPGGLEAGRRMAEACLAGLGDVSLAAVPGVPWHMPCVVVRTDAPIAACMASQYAGWRISRGRYFAMVSGPMRALAAKDPLFQKLGPQAAEPVAVGVLESDNLPPPEVCDHIAAECRVEPSNLTLLVAPTASQAGGVQVVARSVETALHKLVELDFDLSAVESGFGAAPLPPVAKNSFLAMGRTNDAILYGAEVTLWLRADQAEIDRVAARIPSDASPTHGSPFAEIFERHGRDFYQIDPMLFGPAVVTLVNLSTGRTVRAGRRMPEVLERSFGES